MHDIDLGIARRHPQSVAQVKVAVRAAQVPTPGAQSQFLQDVLVLGLVMLSATAMFGFH